MRGLLISLLTQPITSLNDSPSPADTPPPPAPFFSLVSFESAPVLPPFRCVLFILVYAVFPRVCIPATSISRIRATGALADKNGHTSPTLALSQGVPNIGQKKQRQN